MRSQPILLWVLVALASVGATNCAHQAVQADSGVSALDGGDFTSLMEGCGQQLNSGILYCRMREGDDTDREISVIGPPATCAGDGPCVFFKLFDTSGEPAYGGSIPRGKTRATIPWKLLTKKGAFDLGDRGFWTVNHEVHWTGADGFEHKSYSQGEILLRVYRKAYVPLLSVSDDPNFAWHWTENGVQVKMTSGLRTYVEKKQ